MSSKQLRPASVAPPVANYALGMVTTAATRWVHTSGIVPIEPNGSVPFDIATQADVVWQTIGALLDEANMTFANLVSITTYVVVGNELAPVMRARDLALGGHCCASTLLVVPALAQPDWKVEIAVIAAA